MKGVAQVKTHGRYGIAKNAKMQDMGFPAVTAGCWPFICCMLYHMCGAYLVLTIREGVNSLLPSFMMQFEVASRWFG